MLTTVQRRGLGSSTSTSVGVVQSQIVSAAQSAGVDPSLALAVAKQESGFNPTAVSPKGAIGVFQLMTATAAGLGVDPNDPGQNIQGGVKLLGQLLQQYGGDTSLALAAYNAGPSAVAKYGGIPPYPETINYVNSITASLPQTPIPTPLQIVLNSGTGEVGNVGEGSDLSTAGSGLSDSSTGLFLGVALATIVGILAIAD